MLKKKCMEIIWKDIGVYVEKIRSGRGEKWKIRVADSTGLGQMRRQRRRKYSVVLHL